jgi:iron-sulfur cluster assembly protein
MFEILNPVTITARAAEEIRKIKATKNISPDYGLRIGVKGGGCGFSLLIGFDTQKESDHVFSISDITVYVDKKHTMFIIGKEVDYHDGESGQGFVFVESR